MYVMRYEGEGRMDCDQRHRWRWGGHQGIKGLPGADGDGGLGRGPRWQRQSTGQGEAGPRSEVIPTSTTWWRGP